MKSTSSSNYYSAKYSNFYLLSSKFSKSSKSSMPKNPLLTLSSSPASFIIVTLGDWRFSVLNSLRNSKLLRFSAYSSNDITLSCSLNAWKLYSKISKGKSNKYNFFDGSRLICYLKTRTLSFFWAFLELIVLSVFSCKLNGIYLTSSWAYSFCSPAAVSNCSNVLLSSTAPVFS